MNDKTVKSMIDALRVMAERLESKDAILLQASIEYDYDSAQILEVKIADNPWSRKDKSDD